MYQEFSETISRARQDRGMTQEALAEKAGVTIRSITYWENGKKKMTVDSADKVFCALGEKYVIGDKNSGKECK